MTRGEGILVALMYLDRKRNSTLAHENKQARYVVGWRAPRIEAICLCWDGDKPGNVDGNTLRSMYREAKQEGCVTPLHVFGATCTVPESETMKFYQMDDNGRIIN